MLVITAVPSLQTAIEAVECSVGAYVPKPVEPETLLDQVRQVLQKCAPHRALGRVVDVLRRCVEDLDELHRRSVGGGPFALPEMALRRLNASLL